MSLFENITNNTMNVSHIFAKELHKKYLRENCLDLWENTPFKGYALLNNKQKGNYGENIIIDIMTHIGYNVRHRENSGHDMIIEGITAEAKFSLAQTNHKQKKILSDVFIINHVSLNKDWERVIFVGINPDNNHRMFWFSKTDFKAILYKKYFSVQQGGQKGNNDDYICSGKKIIELSCSPYVKALSEW